MSILKKKMNVRLAAQMFSESVADAIEILGKNDVEGFQNSESTVNFIRVLNRIFDIFNSRTLGAKGFKRPISANNFNIVFHQLEQDRQYLNNLFCPNVNRKIIETNRKIGVLGFILDIHSLNVLYNTYFKNSKFFMTYKLSQDNLELFFGKIRSHLGWNNNPTCRQFAAAYKKLLMHNDISTVLTGNCLAITDNLPIILSVPSTPTSKKTNTVSQMFVNELNGRSIDSYDVEIDVESLDMIGECVLGCDFLLINVVSYIAGFVCYQLRKKIRCVTCLDALISGSNERPRYPNSHEFLKFKCKGKLIIPPNDVVTIYYTTEKFISKLFTTHGLNIDVFKVTNNISLSIHNEHLFECLDEHIRDCDPLCNHACSLIKCIISKYVECRLKHAAKLKSGGMSARKNISRHFSNKMVLFNGL